MYDFFTNVLGRRQKKIFVLTQLMKEDLIKYGVDGRKIHVSPDGVDLEQFTISLSKEDARKKLNLPYDKTIVMYTGSFYMYKWKGVDVLLEAAKSIDEDRYLFVLVGANKDEVSQIKRKYSLTNVLLLPHQPHKDIPVFLKAADVLVLPNTDSDAISSRYTSPLKLFEYMASGVPILASNIPSIREVLDNSNAVLFEPGSSKALVSGLKTLISDGELVSGLVKQAKEDVLEYTWHKRAGLVFLEVVT
ncbi:MAG: glycosyl transferase family 1 [Candidatus Magasanikbacteria bacterium]|nr:glycosyl transferase family 1 [Candidatus Magasanikbacteria bacterium]